MQLRTVLVAIFVTTVLAGAVVVGLTMNSGPSGTLTERWTSDTARSILGNHHAPAVGRIDGEGFVYAPTSGRMGTQECKLVAMDATNASERWHYQVPPANCTIHSVADPTIADYDGDGTPEVLATTTEETVDAFDPLTGAREMEANLSDYGYTQPLVTDLTGNGTNEIVVVDVKGKVFVLRPNGTTIWTRELTSYTNAQPAVADFDADGSDELAVGLVRDGNLYLLNGNGTQQWKLAAPFDSSITWMTIGQADADPAIEVIVATDRGVVAAVDGETAIKAEASVGTEQIDTLTGHLHSYAHRQIPDPAGSRAQINELVEFPLPFVSELYEAEIERVAFDFPEESPFQQFAPVEPLSTPSVLHGTVTFTYRQGRCVRDYLAEES